MRSVSWLLACTLFVACSSDRHYERLVGKWEIMSIESRAERLVLDELVESKLITFTGDGNYQQGSEQTGVQGNWKIRGEFLQLIQPEVKDLQGRIVSRESLQEWELILSEEWMIWRGTALNHTQHLEILLKKQKNKDKATNQL